MKGLTMFDPLVKTLAKWYSRQCSMCGITRIEAVLNNFKEKISCPECRKHLTFGSIMFKTLMVYMKMDSSKLSDLSSDKEAMTSINALFRSIGKQGRTAIEIGIPIYVVFDITSRCNLSCIHCYSSEQQGELTTTDVYHVLDMLYKAGAGMIDFGGGEPLLRKDIFDILSYSKQLGLYTSISTNGTLLDTSCVNHLKALNIDHVCISLDGAKPETHDRIRNKKGTYKKTINGIKNCVKAGINTQMSTVFMKNNINELVDIYNLLDSLNADGWYIYDFVPAGRGKELQKEVLNPKQRKRLFEYLQDLAVSSKMTIKPYPYLITINSACGTDTYFYKKYGRLTELFKGCLSARWVCYISSNGDLHPCHLLPHKLGNLKQETFEDIWLNKNNPVLRELRDRTLLKGNCGNCKYRDVCGGCRAQAFWKTGDYLESDRCWIKN
jgi:radical SAM protein with 4Fe4S-binding SPASM domain